MKSKVTGVAAAYHPASVATKVVSVMSPPIRAVVSWLPRPYDVKFWDPMVTCASSQSRTFACSLASERTSIPRHSRARTPRSCPR